MRAALEGSCGSNFNPQVGGARRGISEDGGGEIGVTEFDRAGFLKMFAREFEFRGNAALKCARFDPAEFWLGRR